MSGVSYHTKSFEDQLKQLKNQTISSDIFSFDEPGGLVPMRRTKLKQSDWASTLAQEHSLGIIEEDVDVRETSLENGVREAKPESIFPEKLIDLVQEPGTATMQNPFEYSEGSDSRARSTEELEIPLTAEQLKRNRLNNQFSKGITLVVLAATTLGLIGAGFGISRALLKRNHTRTMIL
jgi:hypothetical protein